LSTAESRQTVEFLAHGAMRTPVSIGCFCADESRCHRSRLFKILRRYVPITRSRSMPPASAVTPAAHSVSSPPSTPSPASTQPPDQHHAPLASQRAQATSSPHLRRRHPCTKRFRSGVHQVPGTMPTNGT
jgi:hypothetical protein